jgi:chlorite dismutase
MRPSAVSFVAGPQGEWRIERIVPVRGAPLAAAPRLARIEGELVRPPSAWVLHGVRTHERYTESAERARLSGVQPPLGRAECTQAALIPISKSEAWWDLAQDERRAVFESRSKHISTGLEYLPAVARRLYHGREIGAEFDFLTWFEFAPADAAGFDDLVERLRKTEEWRYVEREVDIRLSR